MKGSSTCTMPSVIAVSVCISWKLRPARPRSRRLEAINPLRPRSTIQPKVRTTTEVIRGRITMITSHSRSARAAARHDVGERKADHHADQR